jgi:DNA-binding MarR family transcriptional regulator
VDKLASHGLVERLPHALDRRRKLVALTAAGQEAIATADDILLRPPSGFGSLPTEDVEHLTRILSRLIEADGTGQGPAWQRLGIDHASR